MAGIKDLKMKPKLLGAFLLAGLVPLARNKEATTLLARLFLRGGALRRFDVLRASLCRDGGGEIGELLRLQRQELVAGLCCLERPGRRLARRHQRRHLGAVCVDIADDAGLHLERVLERRDRVPPALACTVDQGLVARAGRRGTIRGREGTIDLTHVVSDPLRLPEKLLRALDRLLDLLE